MDEIRFDELTRQLGRGISRRTVLSGLAGSALGAVLGLGGSRDASAACRKGGAVCRKDGDCCTGVCGEIDASGRGRCQCEPGLTLCGTQCRSLSSDAKHCGGCDHKCPGSVCGRGVCNDGVCGLSPLPNSNGRPCNDGNRCTTGDVCNEGVCAGAPVSCPPASQCVAGACDPATGSCVGVMVSAGTPCDDGDPCTFNDACDGAGTCRGTVARPSITCPANVSTPAAAGACGALATFSASATCGATVTCSPPSGSSFSVGETTVTCTATNGGGSAACQFAVTVNDAEAPSVTCPPSLTKKVPNQNPATVDFAAQASDNCSGVSVTCTPPSGSLFQQGFTDVLCVATDGSGGTSQCGFGVTVECSGDCTGKSCGADDGCGGRCNGPCPAPGPCDQQVFCEPGVFACQSVPKEPGTDCSTFCRPSAFCNPNGDCVQAIPGDRICEQTTDPCRARIGVCNDTLGECDHNVLSGQVCSPPGDLCNASYCTATGECVEQPVVCADSECQACNAANGQCVSVRENQACGGGTKRCSGGVCTSPCSNCPDGYCYETLDSDGSPTGSFFCCPEEARLEGGNCCWIRGESGAVINGVCHDPAFVCAGNVVCETECCDRIGTQSGTGTCCPTGHYCIGGGTCKAPGQTCTVDADCVSSGWGSSAVCSELDADGNGDPIPGSGTCCPGQFRYFDDGNPSAAPYSCCPPGQEYISGQDVCCGFPNPFDTGSCVACGQCSFKGIRKCCS